MSFFIEITEHRVLLLLFLWYQQCLGKVKRFHLDSSCHTHRIIINSEFPDEIAAVQTTFGEICHWDPLSSPPSLRPVKTFSVSNSGYYFYGWQNSGWHTSPLRIGRKHSTVSTTAHIRVTNIRLELSKPTPMNNGSYPNNCSANYTPLGSATV